MRTLVASPFEDDAVEILEWAYGPEARKTFESGVTLLKQRPGQSFMNTLRVFDHAEYNRLSSSKVDPFYNDTLLPKAIDKLTSK
jgi:hypothetical protein